ncbi:MAG TPA: hypothetical protein VJI74_00500 [Candidatus Paceibacterota bacterium]
MFKNLSNFSYERNWKEAVGFYLAWLFFTLLVAFLAGFFSGIVFSTLSPSTQLPFSLGVKIGTVFAVIISLTLGILIVKGKGTVKEFSSIILIVASGLLAIFFGGLGGLIIPAYLTTKKRKVPSIAG